MKADNEIWQYKPSINSEWVNSPNERYTEYNSYNDYKTCFFDLETRQIFNNKNMEKIGIKHIAPYLPYDLKVQTKTGVDRLCGIMFSDDTDYNSGNNTYHNINHPLANLETHTEEFYDIKPILRPLHTVIKKMKDDKGREFIPAAVIWSVSAVEEQEFEDYGKIPTYWHDAIKVGYKSFEVRDFELLIQWHFDVFGLIEKGLAVNINSIPVYKDIMDDSFENDSITPY